MAYAIQLLPTYEQAKVLVAALKSYSEKVEREGHERETYMADELRLEILKKLRERGQEY